MLNLARVIQPWKEADALSAHINLYGFWTETAFLTKSGDLGMVLSVTGVDYESLDNDEQQYAVKRLESALKSFGEGFHVYQYLFKTNRPEIPFARYDDELIDAAIDQRPQYFESKRDRLYEVELFYVIVLEGARSKTGILSALARMPRAPQGAIRELKAQFTNDNMKVLLRKQIDADLVRLEQCVQNFTRHLADLMSIEVQGQQAQFSFFRRLLNFDDWRIAGKPQSTQYLDFQVVNSNIEAERDHLRVGDHFVRILTMKEAIAETRPLVLDRLFKIEGNFYVVTEWTPLSMAKARKEVDKRRRHFNMSKSGFLSQIGSDPAKTNQRDVLIDESKQADIENLGECLRALGDGQTLGDFSLTVVLYSTDLQTINQEMGEFTGVFTNADGALFTETYNQLNALFATVPGNYAQNLRKMYLLNSNYADLSFLFTIHPGEKTNPHLRSEYLAVLETDNATPYYLNLHNGEVAHTLILGMTGSGKSFLCNFLLTNAQKYRPQTYIFDIGGSFQSLTEIFGGTYLNVGQESRDFTINPFSLPESKENLQFLFSFFRVLIEGNDKRYKLDFKEERKLWEAIERMYVVAPEQRTLSTFSQIIGELIERDAFAGHPGFAGSVGKRFECARLLQAIVSDTANFVEGMDEPARTSLTLLSGIASVVVESRRSNQYFNDFSVNDLESIRTQIDQLVGSLPEHDLATAVSEDAPRHFDVSRLGEHLEQIATEQGGNLAAFTSTLRLRIRGMLDDPYLGSVINRTPPTSFENWLGDYVGANGASNGEVAVVNLSLIASEVVHVVVAVLARLIFESLQHYRRANPDGLTLPTVLVLEEAHTFIKRTREDEGQVLSSLHLCREAFERIAREDRKFGLGLVLSSQRPSELSPTVLAQCNTFLLHRIVNDADQSLVARLVPDNVGALLRELPSLPSKQAILLGWATPIPVLLEVNELPREHQPQSSDPDFWDVWTLKKGRAVDWAAIANGWSSNPE